MPLLEDRELTFSLENTISRLIEQSNRDSKIAVTPLSANITMTVKAVLTASQLISTAYETVRKGGCHRTHQMAATIFVAILALRPIRTKHGYAITPVDTDALNEECAVSVATDFLKLGTQQTVHELKRTLNESAVSCRDYSYLMEFSRDVVSYMRKSKFPSYDHYNTDISWDEVHEIDKLMNLFCVSEASDARALARLN